MVTFRVAEDIRACASVATCADPWAPGVSSGGGIFARRR